MLDLEIRRQIGRYADGKIQAADLEGWLSAEAWDLDDEPEATRWLALDSMRLLAERMNDDWTDDDLRELLGALSRTYWIQQAPRNVISAAASVVVRQGQQLASAGDGEPER